MSSTMVEQQVEDEEGTGTKGKKGRLKLILVALVVLAVAGAGAWFFVLSPAEAEEEPVPGEVVVLNPIQVNLAAGHYLRVGVALQLVEKAHEVDGSRALDAVIELFSGREMAEVTRPKDREHLKEELETMLEERYHGDVMGVYFTEFVTQ